MLVRLGLALFLSLTLAVLMAWGWNNAEGSAHESEQAAVTTSVAPVQ
ncbi:hypothetical protein [Hydrogenophaga sp. PAMC20947]|nr:hypothetical protein [Hydrogenophaga sp. PAMC20947]